jgi:hypothetical protein
LELLSCVNESSGALDPTSASAELSHTGLLLCFSSQETLLQCMNGPLSLYRLAFGQPRQDDLLALLDQVRDEIAPEALAQLQISLRPD